MISDIFGGIIAETFSLIHPFDDVWMYGISSLNGFDECKQLVDYLAFPHHYRGSIDFINTSCPKGMYFLIRLWDGLVMRELSYTTLSPGVLG